MFKAVLWDFGGVITSSPFDAFNRYEKTRGLPKDFLRSINATNPDNNAWAKLESSQVSIDEFDELFATESEAKGHRVMGKEVLDLLSGDIRPEMVNALAIIKKSRKIGCITNNVNTGKGPGMAKSSDKAFRIGEIMDMFDVVIESSKIGIRKPDPKIYKMTCNKMSIRPEETIYLDDLGINLKPARALGMTTIKVLTVNQALSDLENLLHIVLQ